MGEDQGARGFLGRQQYKMKFTDLDECFLARIILLKSQSLGSDDIETVNFSLLDLFPSFETLEKMSKELEGVEISSSERINETVADFMSALLGTDVDPATDTEPALSFYNNHLESRIKFLKTGDRVVFQACIEDFAISKDLPLWSFTIKFKPYKMAEITAKNILDRLEFPETLLKKMGRFNKSVAPRIDYRKEVELLQNYLSARQDTTGEKRMFFSTKEVPFRHAVQGYELEGGHFDMLTPGSAETGERVLLAYLLEINGQFDIESIIIDGEVGNPLSIHIRYEIVRPSQKNVFMASSMGLTPAERARMNPSQLELYEDVMRKINKACVLGGRKDIERMVAEVLSWLIKKISFSLEEPEFVGLKARKFLAENKDKKPIRMEDEFFLPFLYEKIKDEFGDRVKKKPENFGGEIDLLFDEIPLELKVRRGHDLPLGDDVIKEKYAPGSQAAAYAAIHRIGFVIVLDLPEEKETLTNLSKSANVLEKDFGSSLGFATSIVVMSFHCHHPKPSSAKG